MVIFLLIGIVIKILNNIFSENIFMANLISFISIVIYHILSYIILTIMGYIDYSIILLFRIIVHSIIMTVIYTSISYLIIKGLYNKFGIKHIK